MTDSISATGFPNSFLTDQLSRELQTLGFGQGGGRAGAGGLSGLQEGLGSDELALSPEATRSLQYSRAQFEMNYQVIRNLNAANGTETRSLSFSFSASFEFLQQYSGGMPVGQGNIPGASVAGTAAQPGQAPGAGTSPTDSLAMLEEFFSPEKTAGRILDFALHFFPMSRFGAPELANGGRAGFAEFIGKAIQTGFDQAFQILGQLPDQVKSAADQTHDLVFQGLQDFVEHGLPPEKSAGSEIYQRIEAFRLEMSFTSTSTTTRKAAAEPYDPSGQAGKPPQPSGGKVDTQS